MIVNKVIQVTINNNNELWILSQDMGLFKDRKNEVITAAYGKTLTYNIKTFNFNYIKDEKNIKCFWFKFQHTLPKPLLDIATGLIFAKLLQGSYLSCDVPNSYWRLIEKKNLIILF
ncbi:unnamed protein product [Rhizophagus irregularis]|uniref:Uncharacterized protein n=1 Tax=Rhizophagus irregularis TaxID=588596 RepID=A0A916E779_9GLOM|nr:unnamed protein product [Rhizophagus irregularis]